MELLFSEQLDEFRLYGLYGGKDFDIPTFQLVSDTFTDQTAISFIEQVRSKFERPVTFDEVITYFETFSQNNLQSTEK